MDEFMGVMATCGEFLAEFGWEKAILLGLWA